jgi:hypothetical protein
MKQYHQHHHHHKHGSVLNEEIPLSTERTEDQHLTKKKYEDLIIPIVVIVALSAFLLMKN